MPGISTKQISKHSIAVGGGGIKVCDVATNLDYPDSGECFCDSRLDFIYFNRPKPFAEREMPLDRWFSILATMAATLHIHQCHPYHSIVDMQ